MYWKTLPRYWRRGQERSLSNWAIQRSLKIRHIPLPILFPVTTHLSRWYATSALTGLAFFAALAFYGFHTLRAGKPIFSGAVLDN